MATASLAALNAGLASAKFLALAASPWSGTHAAARSAADTNADGPRAPCPAEPCGTQRSPVLAGPGDLWGSRVEGDQPLRRFFSALAAENFAALLAAMLIVSPVDGLRP